MQWHEGFGMPSEPGCECRNICSRIDLANTEVNETGWNGIADCECNANKED